MRYALQIHRGRKRANTEQLFFVGNGEIAKLPLSVAKLGVRQRGLEQLKPPRLLNTGARALMKKRLTAVSNKRR